MTSRCHLVKTTRRGVCVGPAPRADLHRPRMISELKRRPVRKTGADELSISQIRTSPHINEATWFSVARWRQREVPGDLVPTQGLGEPMPLTTSSSASRRSVSRCWNLSTTLGQEIVLHRYPSTGPSNVAACA